MLDLLDYKSAADDYLEKNPSCEITPGNLYLVVYSLLCRMTFSFGARPQAVSIDQIKNISEFLDKEGYYEKRGIRPTHLKANFADLCGYPQGNKGMENA